MIARYRRWLHRNCVVEFHGNVVAQMTIHGPVRIKGSPPPMSLPGVGNVFKDCRFDEDVA